MLGIASGDRVQAQTEPSWLWRLCSKNLLRKFREGHPKVHGFGLPLAELKILQNTNAGKAFLDPH